jgi:hypothetical protein
MSSSPLYYFSAVEQRMLVELGHRRRQCER